MSHLTKGQPVWIGLEILLDARLDLLDGARVGLICHPASINSRFEHAADLFFDHPRIQLTALFGPQHGIRGETQDNMIEWQTFRDARTGLPAYSLYGVTRKPTPEMLSDVDVLVCDLQDVGTRVYTFVYTMALAMQAARECGKRSSCSTGLTRSAALEPKATCSKKHAPRSSACIRFRCVTR